MRNPMTCLAVLTTMFVCAASANADPVPAPAVSGPVSPIVADGTKRIYQIKAYFTHIDKKDSCDEDFIGTLRSLPRVLKIGPNAHAPLTLQVDLERPIMGIELRGYTVRHFSPDLLITLPRPVVSGINFNQEPASLKFVDSSPLLEALTGDRSYRVTIRGMITPEELDIGLALKRDSKGTTNYCRIYYHVKGNYLSPEDYSKKTKKK